MTSIPEWFAARTPAAWKAKALDVAADQDEIVVVVDLGDVVLETRGLRVFREATRDDRMILATAAEKEFGRKVSWGVKAGDAIVLFMTTSVPVMTRLRLPERRVLDALIDGGVARTRSEALAWCVRLVGENEKDWISDLRSAFAAVAEVREKGPASRRAAGVSEKPKRKG
jgi:hypothetical protein